MRRFFLCLCVITAALILLTSDVWAAKKESKKPVKTEQWKKDELKKQKDLKKRMKNKPKQTKKSEDKKQISDMKKRHYQMEKAMQGTKEADHQ